MIEKMKPKRGFFEVFGDWRWWMTSALAGLTLFSAFAGGWKAQEIVEQRSELQVQLLQERGQNSRLSDQLDILTQRISELEKKMQPLFPPPPVPPPESRDSLSPPQPSSGAADLSGRSEIDADGTGGAQVPTPSDDANVDPGAPDAPGNGPDTSPPPPPSSTPPTQEPPSSTPPTKRRCPPREKAKGKGAEIAACARVTAVVRSEGTGEESWELNTNTRVVTKIQSTHRSSRSSRAMRSSCLTIPST